MKLGLFAFLFAAIAGPCASAAVLGITSSMTTPTLSATATTTDVTLQGFTVGSTSYTNLTFLAATSTTSVSQPFRSNAAGAPTPNDQATAIAQLSDNSLSTGVANSGAKFSLGGVQNQADNTVFFVYEFVIVGTAVDTIDVYALDDMGARIKDTGVDRKIAIGTGNYGPEAGIFKISLIGNDGAARGVTFQLSDFSGASALDGVYGLEFAGSTTWDPLAAGIAAVPEPSSLVLGALSLLGLAARRRR